MGSSWGLDMPSVENVLDRLNGDVPGLRNRWLPGRSQAGGAAPRGAHLAAGGHLRRGLEKGNGILGCLESETTCSQESVRRNKARWVFEPGSPAQPSWATEAVTCPPRAWRCVICELKWKSTGLPSHRALGSTAEPSFPVGTWLTSACLPPVTGVPQMEPSGAWHHGQPGPLSRRLEGEVSTGLLWENLTGLLMLGLRECSCGDGSAGGHNYSMVS